MNFSDRGAGRAGQFCAGALNCEDARTPLPLQLLVYKESRHESDFLHGLATPGGGAQGGAGAEVRPSARMSHSI